MTVEDERLSPRSLSFLGAKIYFEHKPSTLNCLVKNRSENGALIKVENVVDIPETFRLYLTKFNTRYSCQVMWKSHDKLGVQYSQIA